MRRTILRQIYPVYVVVIVVAVAALTLTSTIRIRQANIQQGTQSLTSLSRLAVRIVEDRLAGVTADENSLRDLVADLSALTAKQVGLLGDDGDVLAVSDAGAGLPPAGVRFREARRAGTHVWVRNAPQTGRGDVLAVLATISPQPGPGVDLASSRPAFVYLAESDDQTAIRALDAFIGTAIVGVAVILITAAASFAIVRRLQGPLGVLQEAATRFGEGDLDFRLDVESPAELAVLAGTMNTMADQLRARIAVISRQRNELEAILTSMIEGIVVLDRNGTIKSLNKAASRLFDKPLDLSTGRSVIEYFRNADLGDLVDELLSTGEAVERTVTVYGRETTYVQVHGTAVEVPEEDAGDEYLLVMNDISRLRRLEELRKDFVANVSHELKTPITSIKGFVETLLDGAIDDRQSAERFLAIILQHTNRLGAIIEDLLSLSRLEQDDLRIRFEHCDLRPILERARESCEPAARAKNIDILVSFDGDPYARVSPSLLEQALVNLLDNAVKYSESGARVEMACVVGEEDFTIRVTDQGQGIPQQYLPRIFERFYRVDRGRSRKLGGTGLGLAIVKHIALVHRGEIGVESSPGVGSTFSLRLPRTVGDYAEGRASTKSLRN